MEYWVVSKGWKHHSKIPTLHLSILLVCLLAGRSFAEEGALELLALIDSGNAAEAIVQFESANLTGASRELVLARIAMEKESYPEALRHLARVHALHYREVEWLPAALYYEALIDARMGTKEKKVSALDELKKLYPASTWCKRAENELNPMEKEEGALE